MLFLSISTGIGAVVWANSMLAKQAEDMQKQNTRISIVEYEISKGGRYSEARGERLESRVDRVEASMTMISTRLERVDANLSFIVDHIRESDGQ